MNSPRCWAVLVAAGRGTRLAGERPKQYLELAGLTLLEHSLSALLSMDSIERVIVVLAAGDDHAPTLAALRQPRVQLVTGGAERGDSVLAGLTALQKIAHDKDWVLVHDAARPCVAQADIRQLMERVRGSGIGALLAEPVVDTIKTGTADGLVQNTLDRSTLWRAQTPQMFALGALRTALQRALQAGRPVTDEAAAMEYAGQPVALVAASAPNPKVTVPGDLALAGLYLDPSVARR